MLCVSVFSLVLDISGLLSPLKSCCADCSVQQPTLGLSGMLFAADSPSSVHVCDFGQVFAVLVSLLTLLTVHQAQTDLVFSDFPGDGRSVPRTNSELL